MTDTTEADRVARTRGLELASRHAVRRDGDLWYVPSERDPARRHRVRLDPAGGEACDCPDFAADRDRRPCHHIYAARFARLHEQGQAVPAPEYDAAVPPGAPAWVTAELIRQTLRVWQIRYPHRLTADDALSMIVAVARLSECI
jgi:hypothetical protein